MASSANSLRDESGNVIPASQRPDGTWRKQRRVKEGYTPQEEVPLYESKGKQWSKGKPNHIVGMAPTVDKFGNTAAPARSTIPGLTINPADQAGKSKKKKKKKPADVTHEISAKLEVVDIEPNKSVDPTKKLKNLKKRLREVEHLEQKIATGAVKTPDKDQLEKVKRKAQLMEEIEELEGELS